MLKRIFFVIAATLMALTMVGCACSNRTATPTPTASMQPVSTPSATLESSPDAQTSTSPDAMTSPGANGENATIPNFKEGTEVKPEDVPEIRTAVETKYSGATIKTIRHATKNDQQVYEVEIEQNGSTQKIYVKPDGTILEEKNAAS